VTVDTSGWSGDGDFTTRLLAVLQELEGIDSVKVEDTAAGRSEPGYCFISNEVYVRFSSRVRRQRVRRLFVFPGVRETSLKAVTFADFGRTLAGLEDFGEADYADEAMLQYLRVQRIVPPYQTRGYKLVEMVRIYEVGGKTR
jgi:hypothetical protein